MHPPQHKLSKLHGSLASFSALIFYGDDRIVRVASGPYIVGLTRFCQDKMSLGDVRICV